MDSMAGVSATAVTSLADSANGNRRFKLAFITCCVNQKFFGPVKKGMHDAARMLGVDCEFLGVEGVDSAEQASMISKAVADGYEGLAVNFFDSAALAEIVAATIAKGVPIVAFNVDDNSASPTRLAAVNQRLYAAGRSLAQRALPEIPSSGRILLTKHDEGISALEDRLRGIRDVLESHGISWKTIVTGNDSMRGADIIATTLQQNLELNIILGSGQSDTEAAGRAIESHFAGRGYWSAGFDLSAKTLQLIRDGHIRFTIDQQPYVQGFYPVAALTLKLRYGIMPSNIDAGAASVDCTNVEHITQLTAEGYR